MLSETYFYSTIFRMSMWESVPQFTILIIIFWQTLMLIFHASKINESSSATIRVLNDVPAESRLDEIKYFREYLATKRVELTGCGYFALTKALMLTVRSSKIRKASKIQFLTSLKLTGTLVTYEIVLIQFYDKDIIAGNFTGCVKYFRPVVFIYHN